ncbi:MAG: tetratricopeptide repeat protein [Bryobacterales bacterium]|nr:tetratricopeptide repeat protein [Bryobacterales bacterium]
MENEDSPSPQAAWSQLGKVLASKHFARSPRLSRFLKFTVEQFLAGQADSLKEYLIGVEVFGRPESFDPRTDAIVRVQAVALRSRLAAYYENEGARDPVGIEYPKGSYVPVIRERTPGPQPAAAETQPDSIAVLPFVNMSSDPENEYFSDGLTEELISALSNVHGLRVVARTSVFRYKGKPADVRQIGAELNARMVLEGSVRKAGERLRVTAQLVNARDGYETWSRTYRVDMKDLFAVQQEIAGAIAGTLETRERGSAGRGTDNMEAYHSYLRGRFHLNKWTEEDFRKSAGFFENAIRLDPGMSAAHAGLADALFVLACYGKVDPREVMPRVRAAAQRALELGGSLPEACVSLGAVRAIYDWDWEGAEREFLRAIEFDPGFATAYQWYAVLCLIPQGRFAEAESAARRARELDPLSPPINTSLGLVYFVQGRHDEAIAYFDKALEIDSHFYLAHWWKGIIYLSRSMLPRAIAALRKAGAVPGGDFRDFARFTYREGLIGKRDKARQVLAMLQDLSRRQYVSPVILAAVHLVLGEHGAAFERLDEACQQHDSWLVWLRVDRRFDLLRTDPRFGALLARIGLGERH